MENSAEKLREILADLSEPALFWLDGHYSGGDTARGTLDTPILQELDLILQQPDPGHVLLIDDARCFGTDPAYPSVDRLRTFILERNPSLQISVSGDSIRVEPVTP